MRRPGTRPTGGARFPSRGRLLALRVLEEQEVRLDHGLLKPALCSQGARRGSRLLAVAQLPPIAAGDALVMDATSTLQSVSDVGGAPRQYGAV